MSLERTGSSQRLSYLRNFRFGDVWVQLDPHTNRWRWHIPTLALFRDWSTSHYGTSEDAFYNAEIAVAGSPNFASTRPTPLILPGTLTEQVLIGTNTTAFG